MIDLHIHKLRQQLPQHRQRIRLIDVPGTVRPGQLARRHRQQLRHRRRLGNGGNEPGITQIHLIHLPGRELVNNHPRNDQRILHQRPVAQIREYRNQVLPVARHKIPTLAPYRHASHRRFLFQNELRRPPVNRRVHPAGQPPIRRNHQQPHPLHRPRLQQGMHRPFLSRLRRQVGDDLLYLFGVGPPLHRGVLRPPHLRRRNQRHRVGHLPGVLHAANPPPDIPYAWHPLFPGSV